MVLSATAEAFDPRRVSPNRTPCARRVPTYLRQAVGRSSIWSKGA
jgi:hypothetical protein